MTNTARTEAARERAGESKTKSEVVKVLQDAAGTAKVEKALLGQAEIEEHKTSGISIMLVKIPHRAIKGLRKNFEIVLSKLETLFPEHAVFVIRQRAPSGLKQGEKRRRIGPTRADHQEGVVRDLVLPGNVIDRRTTVRSDGARLEKIFVDKGSEQALENRLEAMGAAFESLFKKKAAFRVNYY
jgi:Ribosomal protein S7e